MPHPMPPATAFDVRQFIDEQPVGRYQLMVASMCSLIVFVDGFDAQAMGYVAPALSAAMQIPRSVLGPVISSGLVGMMIGAMVSGPLADHVGPAAGAHRMRADLRRRLAAHGHCAIDRSARRLSLPDRARHGRRDAQRHRAHLRVHAASPQGHGGDDDDLRVLAGSCGRWVRGGVDHPSLRMAGGVHRWRSDTVADCGGGVRRGCQTRFDFFS